MDCAPLNLAHFHERRADKFIRLHRYEDAQKAVKTSLLYLQDAYENCTIPKSVEVLDTQRWEYERKIRQIQMRHQQHERLKLKEIVPLSEASSLLVRPDNSVTAQSVAKSIDKTIREFDAKFGSVMEQPVERVQLSKENQNPRERNDSEVQCSSILANEQLVTYSANEERKRNTTEEGISAELEDEEIPSLAPLELPSFDLNVFNTSTSTLASIIGLAESLQK